MKFLSQYAVNKKNVVQGLKETNDVFGFLIPEHLQKLNENDLNIRFQSLYGKIR